MLEDNTELLVCKQWSWLFCILKSIYVYIVQFYLSCTVDHAFKERYVLYDGCDMFIAESAAVTNHHQICHGLL